MDSGILNYSSRIFGNIVYLLFAIFSSVSDSAWNEIMISDIKYKWKFIPDRNQPNTSGLWKTSVLKLWLFIAGNLSFLK